MRRPIVAWTALLGGLLITSMATGANQDEPSAPAYPQVGSVIPGPFHVLNLNGERQGRFHCLVCRYALRPTAAILARLGEGDGTDGLGQLDPDQPLAKLIKAFDAISDKYPDAYLGAFAVFIADTDLGKLAWERKLETLTKETRLKQLVFALDFKGEAKSYFPKADGEAKGLKWGEPGVKVLLYNNFRVIEHQDFTKDRPLTDKDVEAFAKQFRQMVPAGLGDKKIKRAAP